jgi:uncharacterized protein YjbI with pentapeptide repeats
LRFESGGKPPQSKIFINIVSNGYAFYFIFKAIMFTKIITILTVTGFLAVGCLAACEDQNLSDDAGDSDIQADTEIESQPSGRILSEADFVHDQSLHAMLNDLVIVHLESHPDQNVSHDTGNAGTDRIPFYISEDLKGKFCSHDGDSEPHVTEIIDEQGTVAARIKAGEECSMLNLSAGHYDLVLAHADIGKLDEYHDQIFIKFPGSGKTADQTASPLFSTQSSAVQSCGEYTDGIILNDNCPCCLFSNTHIGVLSTECECMDVTICFLQTMNYYSSDFHGSQFINDIIGSKTGCPFHADERNEFINCDISGALFQNSTVHIVSFDHDTKLTQSTWQSTILDDVSFAGKTDLSGSTWSDTTFSGTTFGDCNLAGSKLSGVTVNWASFLSGADLSGSSLTGVTVTGSLTFCQSNVNNAHFEFKGNGSLYLIGMDMSTVTGGIDFASLASGDLTGSKIHGNFTPDPSLWEKFKLNSVTFLDVLPADLHGMNFDGIDLGNAAYSFPLNADLDSTSWKNANLAGCNFKKVRLTNRAIADHSCGPA